MADPTDPSAGPAAPKLLSFRGEQDKFEALQDKLKQLKRSAKGKSAVYCDNFDPKIRVDTGTEHCLS